MQGELRIYPKKDFAMLNIHLRVKFRAFGITFGQVEKVYGVTIDGSKLHVEELPAVLAHAPQTLLDTRGVYLAVGV